MLQKKKQKEQIIYPALRYSICDKSYIYVKPIVWVPLLTVTAWLAQIMNVDWLSQFLTECIKHRLV